MENHNGWKRTFLVINKRVGPEFIIEQLEREGSWGRYSLIIITRPGVDKVKPKGWLKYSIQID